MECRNPDEVLNELEREGIDIINTPVDLSTGYPGEHEKQWRQDNIVNVLMSECDVKLLEAIEKRYPGQLARIGTATCPSYGGRTPLTTAAEGPHYGSHDVVKFLIDHRCDPNAVANNPGEEGDTVLHRAVRTKSYREDLRQATNADEQQEVIDLLLRAGANVNAVNAAGATPVELAVKRAEEAPRAPQRWEAVKSLVVASANCKLPCRLPGTKGESILDHTYQVASSLPYDRQAESAWYQMGCMNDDERRLPDAGMDALPARRSHSDPSDRSSSKQPQPRTPSPANQKPPRECNCYRCVAYPHHVRMKDREEKRRHEHAERTQRMRQEEVDTDAMHRRLLRLGLTEDLDGHGVRPMTPKSHARTSSDPFSTPPPRGAHSEPSGSTYASPSLMCLDRPTAFKDLDDRDLHYIVNGSGTPPPSHHEHDPMVEFHMEVDLCGGYGGSAASASAGSHAAPPPPLQRTARARTETSSSDESVGGRGMTLEQIKNTRLTDRERRSADMKGALANLTAMNDRLEKEGLGSTLAPPSSWRPAPRPPRKSDPTHTKK